jgi:hypothetical protein
MSPALKRSSNNRWICSGVVAGMSAPFRGPAGRSPISMAGEGSASKRGVSQGRASSNSPRRCQVVLVMPRRSGFVDDRGSRLAAGHTPVAAAGVPAASGSRPGAVGAQVGLDIRGRLLDGGQIDAEQLRAPRQRRRDRPARSGSCQVPTRPVSNTSSKSTSGNLRTGFVGHPRTVTAGLNQVGLWTWRAAGCQHRQIQLPGRVRWR